MVPRNALNVERVTKSYGLDPVLDGVSLGLAAGERIGVVGRNGGGKSTLVRVLAGIEAPDEGRVTLRSGLALGVLSQTDDVVPGATLRELVLGTRDEHEWASQPTIRTVLTELLGGFGPDRLDRPLDALAGGERRRAALAAVLLRDPDVLILDEPTNHLDVEAVGWLASHLAAKRSLALLVVTHDRWFLDAVCHRTWEVGRGQVESYDGGYSAYVAAKAERARQASAEESRRQNLLRKELAWLNRGARARTSKSKSRLDAVSDLMAAGPQIRQDPSLMRFDAARLGKTVVELHDVSLDRGGRPLLDRVTWAIGPGDRIGIVGVNGAGKTSLVSLLLGALKADSGRVVMGSTVRPALLSQHVTELDESHRVLESISDVASHVRLVGGREISASQLCERIGFGPDRQWTPVGELSGGERRRLQLTRLLMTEPNLLVLDEPTNDLDVETLAAVEDLLDSFGGTLLVISHDRYFVERTCDRVVGLMGDGTVRDLPGGVEEYLKLRHVQVEDSVGGDGAATETLPATPPAGAVVRAVRREMARLERSIAKAEAEEKSLHAQLAEHATDFERVASLDERLAAVTARREADEEAWLAAASRLDP